MKQSRLMSLVESVANVVVGYGVAVVTQILIFPIFGLHTTLAQNLKMGAVFTVVSIARLRSRVFEAILCESDLGVDLGRSSRRIGPFRRVTRMARSSQLTNAGAAAAISRE